MYVREERGALCCVVRGRAALTHEVVGAGQAEVRSGRRGGAAALHVHFCLHVGVARCGGGREASLRVTRRARTRAELACELAARGLVLLEQVVDAALEKALTARVCVVRGDHHQAPARRVAVPVLVDLRAVDAGPVPPRHDRMLAVRREPLGIEDRVGAQLADRHFLGLDAIGTAALEAVAAGGETSLTGGLRRQDARIGVARAGTCIGRAGSCITSTAPDRRVGQLAEAAVRLVFGRGRFLLRRRRGGAALVRTTAAHHPQSQRDGTHDARTLTSKVGHLFLSPVRQR